jgi:hypothetical protein
MLQSLLDMLQVATPWQKNDGWRHYPCACHPRVAGQYPHLAEALSHVVEVVQQPGEAIFVPSGWHHTGEWASSAQGCQPEPLSALLAGLNVHLWQRSDTLCLYISSVQLASCLAPLPLRFSNLAAVENLDDCVSINHNWLNGHNVHWTWALLQLERRQAEEGIEDCRELCRCDAAPLAHTPLCCCNAAVVLCLALRRAPAAVLPLESFVMPCLLTAWLNLRALS